jgi:quercetin dioxygenase-like cupin family protein
MEKPSPHHHKEHHENKLESYEKSDYLKKIDEHKSISNEILIKQDSYEVIRLKINEKATLPKHKSKFNAIIISTQGTGLFLKNEEEYPIKPGSVFNLSPNDVHSATAHSDLELILIFIL